VITTRLPIADLADYAGTSAIRRDPEQLSGDAGAKLLRALGVKGKEAEYLFPGEIVHHRNGDITARWRKSSRPPQCRCPALRHWRPCASCMSLTSASAKKSAAESQPAITKRAKPSQPLELRIANQSSRNHAQNGRLVTK
jgi:hypothetical protein